MKILTLTHSLKSINITLGREGEENMELEVRLVGQNYGEVKTGDSRRQVESRKSDDGKDMLKDSWQLF